MVWVLRSKKTVNSEAGRPRVKSLEAVRQNNLPSGISFSEVWIMLFWNKKMSIILLICYDRDGDKERAKQRERQEKRGRDRCLLSLPCLSLCLCPSCERSAVVAHNLYFIHYSQLRIDWEQRTYRRPARGRERWKGRNVQLDQREGCMAKRSNVHQGCVRVQVFMCVSMKSS